MTLDNDKNYKCSDEAASENIMLEETLESMGALSAAASIRRSYPHDPDREIRFDQHHDNDNDIPERFRHFFKVFPKSEK